jgi:hypothetical protein
VYLSCASSPNAAALINDNAIVLATRSSFRYPLHTSHRFLQRSVYKDEFVNDLVKTGGKFLSNSNFSAGSREKQREFSVHTSVSEHSDN